MMALMAVPAQPDQQVRLQLAQASACDPLEMLSRYQRPSTLHNGFFRRSEADLATKFLSGPPMRLTDSDISVCGKVPSTSRKLAAAKNFLAVDLHDEQKLDHQDLSSSEHVTHLVLSPRLSSLSAVLKTFSAKFST